MRRRRTVRCRQVVDCQGLVTDSDIVRHGTAGDLASLGTEPNRGGPMTDQMSPGHDDLVEAAGHPIGAGVAREGYDPRLTNEDLARCGRRPGRPTTSSPSG